MEDRTIGEKHHTDASVQRKEISTDRKEQNRETKKESEQKRKTKHFHGRFAAQYRATKEKGQTMLHKTEKEP
ncbi:MAG: hypothetical protein J6C26_01140 [Clostridia bacterium]|nr:hypothetical protein [Clostridia bacterium]